MKKLNLNIRLDAPIKDEENKEIPAPTIAIKWISVMLERALNRPETKTGRATVAVTMDVQRKYFRVMEALDKNEKGIAKLEDDDFKFLDSKFNKAEIVTQLDVTKILVEIGNAINKAKVEVK